MYEITADWHHGAAKQFLRFTYYDSLKKNHFTGVCVEYHRLNGIIKKYSHPFNWADFTQDILSANQRFSTLDGKSIYWCNELHT